jgi:hypothetical protein
MQRYSETARDEHPLIDVTASLGEAGHEVELLGFVGIADTGPVVDDHDDDMDRAGELLASTVARFAID